MLTDAGPLVALLDPEDQHHHACRDFLETLRDPLITVWPALTEAMFLLRYSAPAQDDLWELMALGELTLAPLSERDGPRLRELMTKYRDLPMDLADAALVSVAERGRMRRIFTLDRRHFRIYRPRGIGSFEIVP